MKICYVTHASNLTGANNSMLNLICELKNNEKDIEPFVILPKRGIIENELERLNIPYKIVKSYSRLLKIDKKRNNIKEFIKIVNNFIAVNILKRFFIKEKFDIIHVNSLINYTGAQAARKANIKYIWHMREFIEEDHNFKIINEKLYKKLFDDAYAKIAISKAIYNKFSKKYGNKNMYIVYNGIPSNQFNIYKDTNVTFNKEVNTCIIGRIAKGKGQLDAIKAIEEYNKQESVIKAKLYVIGSPADDIEYDKEIKNYVSGHQLEDNIIFVPFTTSLQEYRKKCKICFVCSTKEAFGRVTIEAMLSNQIVIASNTGANPELIENNKSGYLYDNNDDIINILNRIIKNEKETEKIIIAAKKIALDKFSITNTARNIYKIYKNN